MRINKKFITIGALALLCVISLIYLFRKTANTPLSGQSTSTRIDTTVQVDLPGLQIGDSVVFPTIPAQMAIYKPQSAPVDLNQVAQGIANQLSLTKIVNGPVTYWTSPDKVKNVTTDPYNKIITYKISFQSDSPYYKSPPTQSLEKLADGAKTFIASIGLDPDHILVPDVKHVQYFSVVDQHSVVTAQNKANVWAIPFQYQLDNFNLFTGTQTTPTVTVSFGANNTIVQISAYTTALLKFTKNTTVNTKSLDDLKNDLKTGNFQVLNVYTAKPQITDPKLYKDLLIQNIEVQYRLNADNSQVAPYFLLSGQQNGSQITLVDPAFTP